jgi:hypothetical protein
MQKALTINGRKPYEITAEILVLAAKMIGAVDFDKKGLLPPSAILGRSAFFEVMRTYGIEIRQAQE